MRCTARKRTGDQCGAYAVKGATVCRMHGGSAPQVRQAARVRAAELDAHATAVRMVARAGVDVDPIEHLLESLHRAAALVEVWGSMVAGLDELGAERALGGIRGELGYNKVVSEDSRDELRVVAHDSLMVLNSNGQAHIHPYVVLYEQALERRAKFAKLCIDANITERQMNLAEHQGQLMAQVLRGVLTDLGVMDRPEAPGIVRKHLALVSSTSLSA